MITVYTQCKAEQQALAWLSGSSAVARKHRQGRWHGYPSQVASYARWVHWIGMIIPVKCIPARRVNLGLARYSDQVHPPARAINVLISIYTKNQIAISDKVLNRNIRKLKKTFIRKTVQLTGLFPRGITCLSPRTNHWRAQND